MQVDNKVIMEPPNVGGKKGLSELNVSLLGESLLFPSRGADSLLLLRRYDYRASTLLCLWAQGADLKCVGDLEGGLKGRGTRNYLLANQNHWLLSFITHSPFSSSVPLPLQNRTVTPTCRPSLEKLRCICKRKVFLEMTRLFWV